VLGYVLTRYGGARAMQLREVAEPTAGDGEALKQVESRLFLTTDQKVGGSNPLGRPTSEVLSVIACRRHILEPRSRFRGEVDGIGLGEISRSSHRGPLAIFGEEEFVLAYRAFYGVHAER
jgi:hypothetical protein